MAFTVKVVGIFTKGALSSGDVTQRRARVLDDIARANQAWGAGFPGGIRCEINFELARTYNAPNTVINGNEIAGSLDKKVTDVIDEVRRLENDTSAIYVLYISGPTLANGVSVGAAGARSKFNDPTKFVGGAVMTDGSANTFVFAHEAGHVLFGRLDPITRVITSIDPNTGQEHNDQMTNLMFRVVPNETPFITTEQCIKARQSNVIVENS